MIDKSLYGLKTSTARWHETLVDIILKMKFELSKVDADLWMKDCGSLNEYLAVYVDDRIIVSNDPLSITIEFKQLGGYTLKGVGEPEYYLRGDITSTKVSKGMWKATFSTKTYIKNKYDKVEITFIITL